MIATMKPIKQVLRTSSTGVGLKKAFFQAYKACMVGVMIPLTSISHARAAECFEVSANQGWQPYQLRGNYPGRMSIDVFGQWSVNSKYGYVSPMTGHFNRELERDYAQYKYDSRYPFGVLLFSPNASQSDRVAPFTYLPRQGWLRINDSDRTSGNNDGVIRICVNPG